MTRLVVGCALLLMSGGAVWAAPFCAGTPWEAGQVHSGQVLRHQFVLVNRGSTSIEITEVKPGCGCLRPYLEQPTLNPGEQTVVTVDVNTLTQAPGPNAWRAVVHYRENGQPAELPLDLKAIVLPMLQVQPASLVIHTRTGAHGSFTLTEHITQPLALRGLSVVSPHIHAHCSEVVRDGDGWKRTISLDVLPSMPEGRHEDTLKILTTDANYPELSVPFTIVKHSPDRVQASPEAVSLVVLSTEPLASRIVLLSAGDDQPVQVQRVETSHPFVHCTWATGPGTHATLRIQFDHEGMPADKVFEAAIRIHLDKPSAQVVTIPVHCARR